MSAAGRLGQIIRGWATLANTKAMSKLASILNAIVASTLAACSVATPVSTPSHAPLSPPPATVIVTREVTRIVTVIATPLLTPTITPDATQRYLDSMAIQANAHVPTPFPTSTYDCYQTAVTNPELINCAIARMDEAANHMAAVVALSRLTYEDPRDRELFDVMQVDWEKFAKQECDFWHTRVLTDTVTGQLYYENGRLAPQQAGECLAWKYEMRTRELQLLMYSRSGTIP